MLRPVRTCISSPLESFSGAFVLIFAPLFFCHRASGFVLLIKREEIQSILQLYLLFIQLTNYHPRQFALLHIGFSPNGEFRVCLYCIYAAHNSLCVLILLQYHCQSFLLQMNTARENEPRVFNSAAVFNIWFII